MQDLYSIFYSCPLFTEYLFYTLKGNPKSEDFPSAPSSLSISIHTFDPHDGFHMFWVELIAIKSTFSIPVFVGNTHIQARRWKHIKINYGLGNKSKVILTLLGRKFSILIVLQLMLS